MLLTSVFVAISIKKASRERKDEVDHLKTVTTRTSLGIIQRHQPQEPMTKKQYKTLKMIGILSSLASLCLAGVVQPSFLNGIYFVLFIVLTTWFSCNRRFGKKFAILLRVVSGLLMIHITGIILCQIPIFQNSIDENSFGFRILGLTKIYVPEPLSKFNPRKTLNLLNFRTDLDFDVYLNPFILMTTYFVISSTSFFILVIKKLAQLFSF